MASKKKKTRSAKELTNLRPKTNQQLDAESIRGGLTRSGLAAENSTGKYMEWKLKEVLISGVIQNGDPTP